MKLGLMLGYSGATVDLPIDLIKQAARTEAGHRAAAPPACTWRRGRRLHWS